MEEMLRGGVLAKYVDVGGYVNDLAKTLQGAKVNDGGGEGNEVMEDVTTKDTTAATSSTDFIVPHLEPLWRKV